MIQPHYDIHHSAKYATDLPQPPQTCPQPIKFKLENSKLGPTQTATVAAHNTQKSSPTPFPSNYFVCRTSKQLLSSFLEQNRTHISEHIVDGENVQLPSSSLTSVNTSGRLPFSPSTCPTSRSARVSVGSTLVPTPISPPGTANLRSFCSAYSDKIFEKIGSHCGCRR